MARPQKRKRPRPDPRDQVPKPTPPHQEQPAENYMPSKKSSSNCPEPKIDLTRRALEEFNRRNKRLPPPEPADDPGGSCRIKRRKLAKISFPLPNSSPHLPQHQYPVSTKLNHAGAMSSRSDSSRSRRSQSTTATTISSRSKRSSAYDANFEQDLEDHNVYPPDSFDSVTSAPANFDAIRRALAGPRSDLPSFTEFRAKNNTKSEGTVMRKVVPLLAGDLDIPNEGQVPFNNLDSITSNTTANPAPDFFDGVYMRALDKKVREDIGKIIIPSKKTKVVAPSFFLEAKGPGGTIEVAVAQATLDGAHGARIIHALQNYMVDQPIYDGNAYAFSSTLLDGYLKLYAHHMTAPPEPGQRPSYHMTQLRAYVLTDDVLCEDGVAAFRNLRELAQGYRDQAINTANERAHIVNYDADKEPEGGSSPLDFYDCELFAEEEDKPGHQHQQSAKDTPEAKDAHESNIGLAITYTITDNTDGQSSSSLDCTYDKGEKEKIPSSLLDNEPRPIQPKKTHCPPSPSSTRNCKKRVSP